MPCERAAGLPVGPDAFPIMTRRLVLRPMCASDFSDFYRYAREEAVWKTAGWPPLGEESAARKAFDQLLASGVALALEDRSCGEVAGNLCIEALPAPFSEDPHLKGRKGVALSFALASWSQGKGLATEAVGRVVEQLFQETGVDFVNCGYFPGNEASRRLQEKLGFHYYCKHAIPRPQGDVLAVENILTRQEWEQRVGKASSLLGDAGEDPIFERG